MLKANSLSSTRTATKSSSLQLICQMCTRNNNGSGKCPGLNIDCFASKKKGHRDNLEACTVKVKKVNQVHSEETGLDTDSVGKILELVN